MQLSPALCGEGNAQSSASLPPPGTFLNRTMVMSCEPCCAHANATKAFVTTKNYKIKPINSQSVTEMKHFNWCMGIGIFFVKIPNIWALTVVSFFILLQQKYLQIWTNTSHSIFWSLTGQTKQPCCRMQCLCPCGGLLPSSSVKYNLCLMQRLGHRNSWGWH